MAHRTGLAQQTAAGDRADSVYWPARAAATALLDQHSAQQTGEIDLDFADLTTILPAAGLIQTRATASLRLQWHRRGPCLLTF